MLPDTPRTVRPSDATLRHHEGRLYAGGLFTPPGGATNNQVDIWDGSHWTVLPGLSGGLIVPYDFAWLGNDVFFGGPFTLSGLKQAYNFARWNDQIDFDVMGSIQLSMIHASSIGPFKVTVTATAVPSYIIEGSTDFSSWTPLRTNTTSPYEFWDFTAPSHPYRFYRARQGP